MAKIVYFIITLLLFSLLLGNYYPDYIDYSYVSVILSINLFSFLIFIFKKEKNNNLKKQFVKTSSLFIVGFIIVSFQIYVDFLLGFISGDNSFLFINSRVAIKSLLISSIAFNVFCLGYVLNNEKNSEAHSEYVISKNLKKINTRVLFFIASFLLIVYFITVNKGYLAGNYGQVEKGVLATNIGFIFECSLSAILIIKARNLVICQGFGVDFIKTLYYIKHELLLLAIYLLSVVMSGERDIILFNGLFLLSVLLYITKIKFGKIRILLYLGVFSFLLTLLGIARRFKGKGSFSEKITLAFYDKTENYYYADSVIESTKELASSGRVLNIAVNAVEEGENHTYGLFALQDLLLLIPSLKGVFVDFFQIPSFLTSSAQYFTFVDQGAYSTWGVGSNCVADTYIDFGVIGVGIIFFLFGLFTRKLELVLYKKELSNFIILTISLLVFSYSLYISRATIFYSISKLSYIIFFIYFVMLTNKKKFN